MGTACWNLATVCRGGVFAEKALRLDPSAERSQIQPGHLIAAGREGRKKRSRFYGRLVDEHPDYPAAQFLFCVAHACLEEKAQAESVFRKLQSSGRWENTSASHFLDISRRFLSASRTDYARRTLGSGISFGYVDSEISVASGDCRQLPATCLNCAKMPKVPEFCEEQLIHLPLLRLQPIHLSSCSVRVLRSS